MWWIDNLLPNAIEWKLHVLTRFASQLMTQAAPKCKVKKEKYSAFSITESRLDFWHLKCQRTDLKSNNPADCLGRCSLHFAAAKVIEVTSVINIPYGGREEGVYPPSTSTSSNWNGQGSKAAQHQPRLSCFPQFAIHNLHFKNQTRRPRKTCLASQCTAVTGNGGGDQLDSGESRDPFVFTHHSSCGHRGFASSNLGKMQETKMQLNCVRSLRTFVFSWNKCTLFLSFLFWICLKNHQMYNKNMILIGCDFNRHVFHAQRMKC